MAFTRLARTGVWVALLTVSPLVASCASARSYSLDPYSGSYGALLEARNECVSAEGIVVPPASAESGLRGYRCELPRREEERACLRFKTTFVEFEDHGGKGGATLLECEKWK